MKNFLFSMTTLGLFISLVLAGCAQEKATSSKEAIQAAKSMETVEQKADYLTKQAKVFYNSKEFQQAIDIAQYILRYVDKDSQQAKNLLEKAKDALTQKAQGAITDVKKKFGDFGN